MKEIIGGNFVHSDLFLMTMLMCGILVDMKIYYKHIYKEYLLYIPAEAGIINLVFLT